MKTDDSEEELFRNDDEEDKGNGGPYDGINGKKNGSREKIIASCTNISSGG